MEQSGEPKPRKRRRSNRRHRRRGHGSGSEDLEGRAQALAEELREIFLRLYQDRAGVRARSNSLPAVLEVAFALAFPSQDQGSAATEEAEIRAPTGRGLLTELRQLADELASIRDVYREGRTFCFWCESTDCDHSIPPGPQFVFAGYSPTGQPEWSELPALLLDLKDPRVEMLYGRRSALVTRFLSGDQLKLRQLKVFGRTSRTYNILGQLTVGFIRLQVSSEDSAVSVALTLQAAETRGTRGEIVLDLNVIGVTPEGDPVGPFLAEGCDDRLERLLTTASLELKDLEGRIHKAGANRRRKIKRTTALLREDLDRVQSVLLRLGRSLEKVGRQRGRRTKHAEDRAVRGGRPTAKALEDARVADPEKVLLDRRTSAWIVLGPKSRVHVFSPEGKHITSLVLTGDKVERRLTIKRWKTVERSEAEAFLRSQAAFH